MDFSWLYRPVEVLDEHLAGGLDGTGLAIVLLLAALLGLRHALDPDHLVAVTSLVSGERAGPAAAARLGASWGIGHAAILLVVGVPLIAVGGAMPSWIESAAEATIGVVIALLAARLLLRWWRSRDGGGDGRPSAAAIPRSSAQAAAIGVVHGLGGTGAVTVLFLGLLPDRTQAMLAIVVFAPMSVVSMTACTWAYAHAVSRGRGLLSPAGAVAPVFGIFALAFGGWYAGIL